jgi:hypothetical protein
MDIAALRESHVNVWCERFDPNVREIFTMSTRLQKHLKGALLSGLMTSLLCAHGIAGAVTEVEPNDTKAQGQVLVITSAGASVSAMMGTGLGASTADLDIYAFDGKAGDVPKITVAPDANWDAMVYLLTSSGNYLSGADDAMKGEAEIIGSQLDADGTYYVLVMPAGRFLLDGAFSTDPYFNSPAPGGAYTLTVQGVSVGTDTSGTGTGGTGTGGTGGTGTGGTGTGGTSTDDSKVVAVRVLRWHGDDPSLGKFKGDDPIPVAILSVAGFDAAGQVDQASLTFGHSGDEKSLLGCKKKPKDVKVPDEVTGKKTRDGRKDLICYFRPDLAGFEVNDLRGFLKGKTVTGEPIKGESALRIMRLSKEKVGKHKKPGK